MQHNLFMNLDSMGETFSLFSSHFCVFEWISLSYDWILGINFELYDLELISIWDVLTRQLSTKELELLLSQLHNLLNKLSIFISHSRYFLIFFSFSLNHSLTHSLSLCSLVVLIVSVLFSVNCYIQLIVYFPLQQMVVNSDNWTLQKSSCQLSSFCQNTNWIQRLK